jgi:CRP-like cAMP-binding protein
VLLTWPRLARLDAAAAVPERALELLRGVPFLALLPQPALEALALRAVWVTVPAGEPVFRQGDRGDRFYVIAAGEAGVTIDGEERPPLSAGGWFGEIALLRDVPRTATITARTGLDLLALERDDFIAAVTGHPPSSEAAGAVVGARLAARPALGPV